MVISRLPSALNETWAPASTLMLATCSPVLIRQTCAPPQLWLPVASQFPSGLIATPVGLFPVAAVVPETQHRFIEVHPECSFRALTGSVLAPKRTALGRDQRRQALEPIFGIVEPRLAGARPDDILDAYAVLWTALRHQRRESVVLGGSEVDGRGLIMQIVV